MSDSLLNDMRYEYRKWRFSTRVYGTIYPLLRTFLIAASGLVAAKETLADSAVSSVTPWIPVFAITVTFLTSIDTWMRPRDKWRGFMQDRDALMHLILRAEGAPLVGPHREQILQELVTLRQRHHENNVY